MTNAPAPPGAASLTSTPDSFRVEPVRYGKRGARACSVPAAVVAAPRGKRPDRILFAGGPVRADSQPRKRLELPALVPGAVGARLREHRHDPGVVLNPAPDDAVRLTGVHGAADGHGAPDCRGLPRLHGWQIDTGRLFDCETLHGCRPA